MIARRLMLDLLGRIRFGQLSVVEGRRRLVFGSGAPQATIEIRSPQAWVLLLRGSRGIHPTSRRSSGWPRSTPA